MTVNGISGSYYQYQNTLNMLQLSNARQSSRYQAVEPVKQVTSATYSRVSSQLDVTLHRWKAWLLS